MEWGLFELAFFEYIEILLTAILIFAIVYALLNGIKVFGESKGINLTVAIVAALIVSLSGVVTYVVSYAVNWFIIIFFIVFLLIVILLFLGVKMSDITSATASNSKVIVGVFIILFLIIIVKGFFALNNAYDINNPSQSDYDVDTSFNTGVDDVILEEDEEINEDYEFNFNSGLISSALFLLIIGAFALMINR